MIIKLISEECIDDKIANLQIEQGIDIKVICKVEIESGFGYYFDIEEKYLMQAQEYLRLELNLTEERKILY